MVITLCGRYEHYADQNVFIRYPYHFEFEWIDGTHYDNVIRWIEDEVKIEYVLDYTYLLDVDMRYVVFIFKDREHLVAVKLRWA